MTILKRATERLHHLLSRPKMWAYTREAFAQVLLLIELVSYAPRRGEHHTIPVTQDLYSKMPTLKKLGEELERYKYTGNSDNRS